MHIATDHNIIADGKTLNTQAIQALIDDCRERGGGTIRFTPGQYLTGGLDLCDNLTIHLEAGATLLGSPDLEHYKLYNPCPEPFWEGVDGVRGLLFALDCNNITIEGRGCIDGQGHAIAKGEPRTTRYRNIWFARCSDVLVEGVTLKRSGFWMQQYLNCRRVRIQGITVYNHGGTNNDGLDIDSCKDVMVKDCVIDSMDDAICIKSGTNMVAENIQVLNCQTRTHCNHFKLGTESNGGFRNITVDGLVMTASECASFHEGTEGADQRGASGIALGTVDGGCMENITVKNVHMDGILVPFFIRFGDRGRLIPGSTERKAPAYAKNITIENVISKNASSQGCYISGLDDNPIQNVNIHNCQFEFAGGADPKFTEIVVPANRDAYPSWDAYGSLPTYGIFARDVKGLSYSKLKISTLQPEDRSPFQWIRCSGVNCQDLQL